MSAAPICRNSISRFWGTTNGEKGSNGDRRASRLSMLPLFKETVEELFCAGYIKAVFATETLALGINMLSSGASFSSGLSSGTGQPMRM